MKKKILLLSVLSLLLFSACNADMEDDIEKSKTVIVTVGAEKYKWPEGWPDIIDETYRGTDCLNVKYGVEAWGEEYAGIWMSLCEPIEEFDYVEGYEYELLVKIIPIENPPMDAPSCRFVLIKIVSQTLVEIAD